MSVDKPDAPERRIGRRKMLSMLGLAAGAAYVAPVMLQLSEARASSGSTSAASNSRPSRRDRSSRSISRARNSGPSRNDRPRRSFSSPGSSGPSGIERPSRSSGGTQSTTTTRQTPRRIDCKLSFSDGRMQLKGEDCPAPLFGRRNRP